MRALVLAVPRSDVELAADRLWAAGARAVEERDVSRDVVELVTVLASSDAVSLDRLGSTPTSWSARFVDLDDAPTESWRDGAQPNRVNQQLVIRPAWLAPSDAAGGLEIAIEPGGAFGLGDHPTTRLSADMVHRLVRHGDRVLDVGCGSGVLSVVAARCGAASVLAIDVAETAREATDDNARRNGVADVIRAETTSIDLVDGVFDLVVANILAPALIGMADDLRRLTAPHGWLIVSGVLAERHGHVLAALLPMRPVDERHVDGWSAIVLQHP
jgi:ribosomal protein L11 methyltransferase